MLKEQNKRITSLFLVLFTALTLIFSVSSNVYAAISSDDAYANLYDTVKDGTYHYVVTDRTITYDDTTYKQQGGGFFTWKELFSGDSSPSANAFDNNKIGSLKASAKQKFVENVITIANYMASDTAHGNDAGQSVTADTVNVLLEKIQNECGMGSEVLAAVLNNTQPDYTSASRIWEPFSGPVSTAIGLLAIAMMSLLGLSMALDIAYVVIPAFQLFLDGGDGGSQGGQGGAKGLSKLISKAARDSVNENAQSNGGSGGDSKSQVGTYMSKRWKELVMIGFCLLYLVQGQIWGLISWLINLVSGVLD